MAELLSALNQILDGLGLDPKVGQTIMDIIYFLVNDLPAFFGNLTGN